MGSRYQYLKHIGWCHNCGKETYADYYCYTCMVRLGIITPIGGYPPILQSSPQDRVDEESQELYNQTTKNNIWDVDCRHFNSEG